MEADYAVLMRRLLAELSARADVETHLIAHVAGARADGSAQADDDGPVIDALAREFPAAVRAPDFAGPSEAKSYISSLDFLVGGRMHACIAALSSGVAVAPVAYSRKFAGLFGMLGYRWLVPVTGMDTDAALAFLIDCIARREALAADAAAGMTRAEALVDVYREELRRFLAEAANPA
jgi:polysaccharide pyruvyl transferase WcaK-like protein